MQQFIGIGNKIGQVILLLFLLIALISCQSGRARKLAARLDSTERKAFKILSSDGSEKRRLEALVARNPDAAQEIANQQIKKLKDIIAGLKSTDIGDLTYAEALIQSNIQYYMGYLDLKRIDIEEARLMRNSIQGDRATVNNSERDLSKLTMQRLKIYKQISFRDSLRQAVKSRYDESNHLR